MTPPSGLKLIATMQIAPDTARRFVVAVEGGQFLGFIVHKDGGFYGYADLCPHTGLSLTEQADDTYLTPQTDLISCARHGALFRISGGQCIAGPCAGRALMPWPVKVEDGYLITA